MATAANAAASAPLRSLLSRLSIQSERKGSEVLSAACSELRGAAQPSPSAADPSATPSPGPLREALDEIRALRLHGAVNGKEDVALAHAIERRRAILRGQGSGGSSSKPGTPPPAAPAAAAAACSGEAARGAAPAPATAAAAAAAEAAGATTPSTSPSPEPAANFKTPRFAPSRLTAALAKQQQQQQHQQPAAATPADDDADAPKGTAIIAPTAATQLLAGKRPRRGSLDVASREGHEPPAKAALPPPGSPGNGGGAGSSRPSSPTSAALAAAAANEQRDAAAAQPARPRAPRPAGLDPSVVVVAPPEATAAASTAAAAAVEGPPTPPPVPGGGPAATTTLLLHADAATPPPPEASAAAAVDARALATWSGALRQRMGGPRSPLVAELCRLSLAAPALVAGALPPVLEVARLVPRRGVALGRHLVLRAALADDVKPRQRAGLATLASAQLVAVVPLPTLDALAPLDDDDEEEDGQQEGAGAGGGKAAAADRPPRAGSALHLVPYVDGAGCAQLVGFLSLPWLQEPPTSSSAGEASEEEGGRAHGPAAV